MFLRFLAGIVFAAFLSACGADTDSMSDADTAADEQVVNIYSSRHYDTDLQLYEGFTAETGIAVPSASR